jgi:hypothetical protein
MSDTETWIKDGTAEAEPVTTETPVEEVVAEAAAETVVADVVETVEATEVVAETDTVQQFIEGKHGDDAFQIPQGLMVPQTRDGVTEMVSIEDVLLQGMMGNDYRLKTTELAQGRRTLERGTDDLTAREARLEAKVAHLDEREAEMNAALTDPESAAAYQEHLQQYSTNEMYRRNVDAGLASHDTEAELSALRANEDRRIVSEASQQVVGWIDQLKGEYGGVDPARVQTEYARALSAGTAPLDISAVRNIFQSEANFVDRTLTPLKGQLAEITAQLRVLQDGAAADQHNETTAHAVRRAKTTPVSTGSGAPGNSTPAHTKFGPNELQERQSDWVKAGTA